jgi:hypothetical protein
MRYPAVTGGGPGTLFISCGSSEAFLLASTQTARRREGTRPGHQLDTAKTKLRGRRKETPRPGSAPKAPAAQQAVAAAAAAQAEPEQVKSKPGCYEVLPSFCPPRGQPTSRRLMTNLIELQLVHQDHRTKKLEGKSPQTQKLNTKKRIREMPVWGLCPPQTGRYRSRGIANETRSKCRLRFARQSEKAQRNSCSKQWWSRN